MPTPSLPDEVHDKATSIDSDYVIHYRRERHRHQFPIELQRRIYVAFQQTRSLSKTTKRFEELCAVQKYISSTVIGAVLRRIQRKTKHLASKPQPERAHWNYVTTGSRADPPSSAQQANDGQRIATQSVPDLLASGDFDHDDIDFDQEELDSVEGEMSQSMNAPRVMRRAPNTQQANTSNDGSDIPRMIDDLGKTLQASRGHRVSGQPPTASGQTGLGQQGMPPVSDVAELRSTLKKDLKSGREITGRGQTDQGQPGPSPETDVADLISNFRKKLKAAREQEGTSSSTARGKRRHQG